jgi:hypothetical protein
MTRFVEERNLLSKMFFGRSAVHPIRNYPASVPVTTGNLVQREGGLS